MSRHRQTVERWQGILAEMRSSGLSPAAFAAANDLNPRTLVWWRWALGEARSQRASPFLEVETRAPRRGVSLVHQRLGICVEVEPDTDLQLLRSLLEALC